VGNRRLTLVGGGGVRGPLFVEAAARRAARLGITEITLFDIDAEKLDLLGGICRGLAADHGVRVTAATDARAALAGADFVVTTIRVGGDRGRVLDERVAMRHGVLGQETTGAGGFAMAMRSIPAILEYAEILAEVSPGAWLFNFTNPAGLVTQALHDAGHHRAVGICDSANAARDAVAAHHGLPPGGLRAEVFGLNHLSWTRAVRAADGTDLLAPLLRDPGFRAATHQRFFPAELAEWIGMWINEYLFYYYFAEQAVERIGAERQTRGEEVLDRNARLLDTLREIGPGDPARALTAYRAYEAGRSSTYMRYADPGGGSADDGDTGDDGGRDGEGGGLARRSADQATSAEAGPAEGGYAGVALDLIEALVTGTPDHGAVNIPNRGAVAGLADDGVVEFSAVADADGVRPASIGAIPDAPALLVQSVKRYERLAARAIVSRSRDLAVQALMAHPLVLSYSRALALVADYLDAHDIAW
jgi:6-phospho-beta-glucosidase